MDSSTIEMLYHAFCESEEGRIVSKEYRRLSDERTKYYEELIKTLNKEQKTVFMKISDNATDSEAEEARSSFRDGFVLGFRLAMEMFVTD